MTFLRKGILVSGGQVIGILLGLIVGILYSRILGPEGMGQYHLLRSTSLIIVTMAALGIGNANIYFLNNRKTPIVEVTTNALKSSMVMGALLAVLTVTIFLAFPGYFGRIPVPVVIFFATGVAALLGNALLRQILTAQMAVRRMVTVSLTEVSVGLVGGAAMGVFGWLVPETALIVLASGYWAGFILLLVYLRPHIELFRSFNWKLFGDMLVYGLKLAAASVLYLLCLEISVMLLRYLKPDRFDDIGLYSRAVAIAGLVALVPRMLGPLLFAKWSGVTGQARTQQVEMALRMSVTYGIMAAIPVVLLGKYLIWFLYGVEFLAAQEALRILAPALIFLTIFNVCSNLLAGDGRAVITVYILAGTLVVLGVTAFLLVPVFGIAGAALAVLCGNAFTGLVNLAVCRRLYGLNLLNCLFVHRGDLAYIRQAMRRQ